jgi:hypothetical protein
MRYRINEPRIALEQFEEETIVIDFDSGSYFSIGPVGSEIIRWISRGVLEDEVILYAERRYSGSVKEIERGIRSFLTDLQRESILAVTEEKTATLPILPKDREKLAFEVPVLNKYTDMKDLLLLDPIHEVDHEGWPIQKTDE